MKFFWKNEKTLQKRQKTVQVLHIFLKSRSTKIITFRNLFLLIFIEIILTVSHHFGPLYKIRQIGFQNLGISTPDSKLTPPETTRNEV